MAAAQSPTPAPILKLHARVEEINRRRSVAPVAATPGAPSPLVLHLETRVTGVLLRDATVHTEPATGCVSVKVLLKQSFGDLPVCATRRYDSTASSHIAARSLAKRLRAGTVASVHGEGMRLHHEKGQTAIEVLLVGAIYPQLQEQPDRKDLA